MPYDDEHHCLCFLPDGRLAVSTGAQADMALADVAILNADTGAVEGRYESQVATSYGSFAPGVLAPDPHGKRSEEHTSELQSLMRISYAVFCLKKKNKNIKNNYNYT